MKSHAKKSIATACLWFSIFRLKTVDTKDSIEAEKGGKCELIDSGTDKRYVGRNSKGQFKESDDVGRSQRADRARKTKRTVKSGYGDRGDQARKQRSNTSADNEGWDRPAFLVEDVMISPPGWHPAV